jgi:hypothetical protein
MTLALTSKPALQRPVAARNRKYMRSLKLIGSSAAMEDGPSPRACLVEWNGESAATQTTMDPDLFLHGTWDKTDLSYQRPLQLNRVMSNYTDDARREQRDSLASHESC